MVKTKKKINIPYIITWILILLFFWSIVFSSNISNIIKNILWKNQKHTQLIQKINTPLEEKLKITIIDDKRCINCNTKNIVFQLQEASSLVNAIFIEKDFSETWVQDILSQNDIKKLPAILFSNNNVDKWLSKFLKETKAWLYSLNTWASFDPFIKRSDKGFLLLNKNDLEKIKNSSYIKWNKNAKITWLQYSDLECPYCAKLHNSDVPKTLEEKYLNNLNEIFNNFPLKFHKNAMPWAEILECLWEQKWKESFYSLIDKSYSNENSEKDFLIKKAIWLWANETKLNECLNNHKFLSKIASQETTWSDLFWITWTPGNILINNDTLEYWVISWAYPKEDFIKLIDKLLK